MITTIKNIIHINHNTTTIITTIKIKFKTILILTTSFLGPRDLANFLHLKMLQSRKIVRTFRQINKGRKMRNINRDQNEGTTTTIIKNKDFQTIHLQDFRLNQEIQIEQNINNKKNIIQTIQIIIIIIQTIQIITIQINKINPQTIQMPTEKI